jgi:flagellar L-ring protein FlgH
MSLMLVEPPKPRTYEIHDLVTIIISETSRQSSEQSLDTKKDANLKAAINKFPDLAKLLEAELTGGNSSPVAAVDVGATSKFKGDGKFERSDRFTDKIEATVIDVKPNGVLVLEARKTVGENREMRTVVLSGSCRREDVTNNNTVLSSQLAELTIITNHEGDVKNAASKGLLTRLFDAVFNF